MFHNFCDLNVLHVVESVSSNAGGLQSSVSCLVAATRRLGVNASVISVNDEGKLPSELVPTTYLNYNKFGKYKIVRDISQLIIRNKADIVLIHGVWAPICAQAMNACKINGIPYIVSPHGMLSPYILSRKSKLKAIALKIYLKKLLIGASAIRVLNKAEESHVIECTASGGPFWCLPNGIVLPKTAPTVFRNPNEILHLGRIDPQKSSLELVTSWSQLQSGGLLPEGAVLSIVGWSHDKAYESKVKLVADKCSSIVWHGPSYAEERWLHYFRSSGYILPSIGEGLPTTVLEALVGGAIPIISEHCNFEPEVFSQWALHVSPNVASISKSIVDFFNLPIEARSKLVATGGQYVKQFDWDAIAGKLLNDIKMLTVK